MVRGQVEVAYLGGGYGDMDGNREARKEHQR